jgi:DNA (cytosine-5)-methyltransferase 1
MVETKQAIKLSSYGNPQCMPSKPLRSVELFAGAGGLALGLSSVGVAHEAVVEWNHDACETIRANQAAGVDPVVHWPSPFEGDVRSFDYAGFSGIDLVTGGPPCQPFSMGGKHRAFLDSRDMFPQAVRAIREVRPRAFVFENVRGLARASFSNYFAYILLQMEFPGLVARDGEEWEDHLSRLERHKTSGGRSEYRVVWRVLNAADYGVPQQRWRVLFVGFREDTGLEFSFPPSTHSLDGLLHAQYITGHYWDEHKVAKRHRPSPGDRLKVRVARLAQISDDTFAQQPRWLTVRDAISDLPDPESPAAVKVQAHRFQPGARSYPGHTGSPLDEPAKALKAGDHGVPGGENMLRRPDGSVRYFTVRESARVQTFPDTYQFFGSWSETMRQLGNAVPVRLAAAVGGEVVRQLAQAQPRLKAA